MPGTAMTTSNGTMDVTAFAAMIEAFGADRARWPDGRRQAAEQLLAVDGEARRRLHEAAALDRLLGRADQVPEGDHGALMARILSEAGVEARDNVVRLPTRSEPEEHRSTRQSPMPMVLPSRRLAFSSRWQAAAVLALALLTGVAIGSLDVLQGPLGGLTDIVSSETEAEPSVASLVLDGLPGLGDEDQL